jgi:hypothetical protein
LQKNLFLSVAQTCDLKAYRSSIYFPELLFELGLSGYREERLSPDDILCSMKLSALLSRQKGRDFYDALFLLAQTQPNYDYLVQKRLIHNWHELKTALLEATKQVDLQHKSKDFEHLLFNNNSEKILLFKEFPDSICQ